jgi:hypothetical protein
MSKFRLLMEPECHSPLKCVTVQVLDDLCKQSLDRSLALSVRAPSAEPARCCPPSDHREFKPKPVMERRAITTDSEASQVTDITV